jgi:hypothetical protein
MASKPNADTSKMSPEEVNKLNLHGAKRPPGQSPGGVLHQTGDPATFIKPTRYPLAIAAVLAVAGIGSYVYFRSSHPEPGGQAHSHSPAVQKAAKKE